MNRADPFRFDQVRFVLSHTSHPGNVGSAARAMKTMGLSDLVLVRPKRFPDRDGLAMSSKAIDVYAGARLCNDLSSALADAVLVFALTARPRDMSAPVVTPREAAREAVGAAVSGPVVFLFGNEESGLANDEILRAHGIVEIPANPEYASLNVAAAVQLIAYEVRMAALETAAAAGTAGTIGAGRERPPVPAKYAPATVDEIEGLYGHFEAALREANFLDPRHPGRLMDRLRRLFGRSRLEREEVNILRGMLTTLEAAVAQARAATGGRPFRRTPDAPVDRDR